MPDACKRLLHAKVLRALRGRASGRGASSSDGATCASLCCSGDESAQRRRPLNSRPRGPSHARGGPASRAPLNPQGLVLRPLAIPKHTTGSVKDLGCGLADHRFSASLSVPRGPCFPTLSTARAALVPSPSGPSRGGRAGAAAAAQLGALRGQRRCSGLLGPTKAFPWHRVAQGRACLVPEGTCGRLKPRERHGSEATPSGPRQGQGFLGKGERPSAEVSSGIYRPKV